MSDQLGLHRVGEKLVHVPNRFVTDAPYGIKTAEMLPSDELRLMGVKGVRSESSQLGF